MVLLFVAVMVSSAGFILEYSPTLLITLKSECCPHANVTFQVSCSNLVMAISQGIAGFNMQLGPMPMS